MWPPQLVLLFVLMALVAPPLWPGAALAADPQSPVGAVDRIDPSSGFMSIVGWAFDPNFPTEAIEVHVYVDGVGRNIGPARVLREDIAAAFPSAGPHHGFAVALGGYGTGSHVVEVYAINRGAGSNVLLGSGTFTMPGVPAGTPFGSFDSAAGLTGGRARLRGWGIDPDAPGSPIEAHAYVDGPVVAPQLPGVRGINLGVANAYRPDVGTAHPGSGEHHGIDEIIGDLAPGDHVLWLYLINAAGSPGGNLLLGVKPVSVPAKPAPPRSTAPPAPSPTTGAPAIAATRDFRILLPGSFRVIVERVARGSRIAIVCLARCGRARKGERVGYVRRARPKQGRVVLRVRRIKFYRGTRFRVRVTAPGKHTRFRDYRMIRVAGGIVHHPTRRGCVDPGGKLRRC